MVPTEPTPEIGIPDRRPVMIELLELLASPEQQVDYERNVPQAFIPDELVCMWFDDLYIPQDAYFRSCFSEAELAAMADFHTFYEKHEKELPRAVEGIAAWIEDETWQRIMARAQRTLVVFRDKGDG